MCGGEKGLVRMVKGSGRMGGDGEGMRRKDRKRR